MLLRYTGNLSKSSLRSSQRIIENGGKDRYSKELKILTEQSKLFSITKIVELDNTKTHSTLAISCVPGKPGKTNITEDVELVHKSGYNIVVCLLTWDEMEKMGMMQYPSELMNKGILFLHMPIFDGSVPHIREAKSLVNTLVQRLLLGNNVLIHCRCGYGRAGTIAACILLHFDYDAKHAIELVRSRRHGAIQTNIQEEFVRKYKNSI